MFTRVYCPLAEQVVLVGFNQSQSEVKSSNQNFYFCSITRQEVGTMYYDKLRLLSAQVYVRGLECKESSTPHNIGTAVNSYVLYCLFGIFLSRS